MADSGTSNPNPPAKTQANDNSLANQFNANVFPGSNDPPVFNESPATKKSYSWNKNGGTGNGPK
jgi:hypothetical protein